MFRLLLLLVALLVFTTACSLPINKKKTTISTPPIANANKQATSTIPAKRVTTNRLKKFDNYAQLAEFLAANNNPEADISFNSGVSRSSAPLMAMSQVSASKSAIKSSPSDSGSGINSLGYSQTNNQVQGVDEADIIKTDGHYIYALVRNELSIIKAEPASEAQVVSKITFKSRPQDIFIHANHLVVFGSDVQIYRQTLYNSFRRRGTYTFFKVFDISDPSKPKQVRDLDFEGNYYDARLIGNYVYFITNTYNRYIANEPLIPRVIDDGQVLATKCSGQQKCFAPNVYYFDVPYHSYNFTNITAINISDNSQAISGQVYLLSGSQKLYVSQKNIYITYTQYLSEYDLEQQVKRDLLFPKLDSSDQEKIRKIEAAPSFILNDNEKKIKISQILDWYFNSLDKDVKKKQQDEIDASLKKKIKEKSKEMEKTIIHKIAIKDDKLIYQAMGEVNGRVLNQFSMDENGDYFRIATTRSQQYSRFSDLNSDSYSNLYILDSNLKVVGSLENLATAERIYAVRFLGDRAYLVTFKQTDPLFVISLKNPKKPSVLGALKVPGFSNYLHPINSDGSQLIGLGKATETDSNGRVKIKGLKLSLFDFTDLKKPKEVSSYLIGTSGDSSIALYDHHAFLYSEAKHLLVIPATLRTQGKLSFSGALVFSVKDNKLNLRAKIDHSAGGHFDQRDYWQGFNYYNNTVKRSLYINDDLFTFSNKFLKINKISDLSEVKSLELTLGGDDYIITKPLVVPETNSSNTKEAETPPLPVEASSSSPVSTGLENSSSSPSTASSTLSLEASSSPETASTTQP